MKNVSVLDSVYLYLKIDLALSFSLFAWRSIKTTENWFDVILFYFGIKKQTKVVFRNKQVLENLTVDSYPIYRNIQELLLLGLPSDAEFVEIKFRGHKVLLKGDEAPFLTSEIFFDEAYKHSNPDGKDVVDIGANIGDSAIYFVLRGAKHVYGFEPYSYVYKTALENTKLNRFEDKITMLNSAIGDKDGTIILNPETQSFVGSDLKASAKGDPVSLITLENVVNQFKIKDGLLKIDCEGSEYQILFSTPNEVLRNFNEIILEYHYGYLDLKNKLEQAGFSVKMLGFPVRRYNPHASNSRMTVGVLHAKRKLPN